MKPITRLPLFLLLWLGLAPYATAQRAPFPHHLLGLMPDDFAVCIVMHDLRGNSARWDKADWLKRFRDSPLGKSYADSPELRQLEQVQNELKKHLDLDWPALRDDILGDTLILSYTPGPKTRPNDEHGLFLLQVREPEKLVKLIDKLNAAQIEAGKVKLSSHAHKGVTYQCRVEGTKTQFYLVKDALCAIASNEAIMHAFLDRRAKPPQDNVWKKRFERAGADSAFLTLCVNPRKLDAEIEQSRKKGDPLPGYWRALEAIFVTASIKDDAQVRIVLQADIEKLPAWAKGAFTQTTPASSLWQRFPDASIVTIASKTDFTGLADAVKMLVPEADGKKLDPFQDLLANIGPDWGVCVLPSKDAQQLPPVIFALAVQPGPKGEALVNTVKGFVELAVKTHNQKNPEAKIDLHTAIKDGFLLIATSPDAIASFRLRDKQPGAANDVPMMRISAPELAKLLEHRREHILRNLNEKDAKKNLDNLIAMLSLFDRLTFSQHGGAGQAAWTIRLTPARAR